LWFPSCINRTLNILALLWLFIEIRDGRRETSQSLTKGGLIHPKADAVAGRMCGMEGLARSDVNAFIQQILFEQQ
jgi:hypothetical protein